ncbi:MAG: hypothetical protein HY753_04165 [Nitrospirae bacterium]|nr:hypothetical protein [Nitrospirota bacterium]
MKLIRYRQVNSLVFWIFVMVLLTYPIRAYSDILQPKVILPFSKTDPIDKKISYFDEIAGNYPPNIQTEAELAKVIDEWNQTEKELISKSKGDSESANMELRFGHLYRYGHNLNIKETWDKSEMHFRKAISLSPDSIDAFIGLAVLYVNTSPDYAAKSEQLFKKAIELSKETIPLPALSGLYFSYYYQGKLAEAIEVADKYLQIKPDDEIMKFLKKTAQDVKAGTNK